MSYRKHAGNSSFGRTAVRTKKINVNPKISRRGVCL